ncbi:hypothetical protein C0Z01_15310 [Photobacterium kishitanii]|uniref:DUF2780 domain-containing protein n=1 Tax=Photobacterium kishitanii TaxID=318456 RepID=A0A2T3KC97_9GAMM|nr:DUF2780 domain-containing protein [Photobacterium kishitanii]KJG08484.1 hypothetical protein UB40_17655 [Photobacterium kishitanii]KJG55778.1 hypothetical protein UA38_17780 [Photobacterium kishitanii]KJG58795.1 hypothetical protein UA42_19200 [Photobacterium kishitanii]KJG63933.1 hypothetical protein UA40_19215 [Photobacterium kishitanii]KJG67662.1 hypothetical protein UA41_18800 [Photobacterium kishitanii]
MKKRRIVTTLAAVALLSSSTMSYAFSLSDIFGGESADQVVSQVAQNPLTKTLISELGVKPEQAAGGAGALLGLAASQLSGPQGNELAKLIPGAEKLTDSLPLGLGQLLSNQANIDKVFSVLGMDPSMINKFIPVITQFLGQQGASNALLGALDKVWAPAAK